MLYAEAKDRQNLPDCRSNLSKDTDDQARFILEISNFDEREQLILVTSAAHMPRTVALFKRNGLNPIPAPIEFWTKKHNGINPKNLFPTASGLRKMERVLHEYLGLVWISLKKNN